MSEKSQESRWVRGEEMFSSNAVVGEDADKLARQIYSPKSPEDTALWTRFKCLLDEVSQSAKFNMLAIVLNETWPGQVETIGRGAVGGHSAIPMLEHAMDTLEKMLGSRDLEPFFQLNRILLKQMQEKGLAATIEAHNELIRLRIPVPPEIAKLIPFYEALGGEKPSGEGDK